MKPSLFNKSVAHPLQSCEWGAYFEKLGASLVRCNLKNAAGSNYGIQVLIQRTAVSQCSLAYVPRAPFPDTKQLALLEKIKRKYSCVSIKVEPDEGWFHPLDSTDKAQKKKLIEKIKTFGGVKSAGVYPRHTMIIPLQMTEEALLAKMHQKTRYNVRISERKGIKVSVDNSERCFKEFLHLFYDVTVVRERISFPHPPEVIKAFWKVMKPTGNLYLLKAAYHEETLAIMMLYHFNHKLYFPHGASSRVHSELMPNHGLMWQAMKLGKKLGCSALDLWGINNSKTLDEFDRNSGLFRFYSGFGAKVFERLGAFDFLSLSKIKND